MVPNSSPAKSVKEFIDYAKANRGKVTFASTGIGASPHLSGELFKRKAGIEMTHVPYRGAGPAMNDLIPGRVDAMFSNCRACCLRFRAGQFAAWPYHQQALTRRAGHTGNRRGGVCSCKPKHPTKSS
jgi:tripartite-type tricarboxylate transporter receptor subunit TctC